MTYDDDQYDDDELDADFDDSDAYVKTTNGYVGDAEQMLRRAIDVIATAPTMPLSSSPRIDRDEIIELLDRRDLLATSCFVEKVGAPDERRSQLLRRCSMHVMIANSTKRVEHLPRPGATAVGLGGPAAVEDGPAFATGHRGQRLLGDAG